MSVELLMVIGFELFFGIIVLVAWKIHPSSWIDHRAESDLRFLEIERQFWEKLRELHEKEKAEPDILWESRN